MRQCTALLLFESSDNHAVLNDPANEDWVALLSELDDGRFNSLARRYYLALRHFRKQAARPAIPGQKTIKAQGKEQAQQEMLAIWEQRKVSGKEAEGQQGAEVFVETRPSNEQVPEALRDFTKDPPPLSVLLEGPGRPPCDALCLLRAFLSAPLLGVDDAPTSVYRLLHSNPTFAHHCGFLGRDVLKQSGELTSRRLPKQAVCEEFSEVMTRYGLWHLARMQQVRENLASGVVKVEETAVFDTTHVEANSHCANVVPANTNSDKDNKKPKHRKVPRMRKRCSCGQNACSWLRVLGPASVPAYITIRKVNSAVGWEPESPHACKVSDIVQPWVEHSIKWVMPSSLGPPTPTPTPTCCKTSAG